MQEDYLHPCILLYNLKHLNLFFFLEIILERLGVVLGEVSQEAPWPGKVICSFWFINPEAQCKFKILWLHAEETRVKHRRPLTKHGTIKEKKLPHITATRTNCGPKSHIGGCGNCFKKCPGHKCRDFSPSVEQDVLTVNMIDIAGKNWVEEKSVGRGGRRGGGGEARSK